MGLQGALYTGVSALSATGEAMNVIGNNLANSNTTAFKASRTLFSDLLASNVSSSSGTSQVGTGVGLATVDTVFSQGGFNPTSSSTDLAIEGEGFFIVRDGNTGAEAYSRAGGFTFNDEGYLVNPQGYQVQGYALDEGKTVGALQDIKLNLNNTDAASQTDKISFNTNLNAAAESPTDPTGALTEFDVSNPSTSSNFSTSINVYDSLGQAHLTNVYMTKTDDPNEWQYNVTLPQSDLAGGGTGEEVIAKGYLTFGSDGSFSASSQSSDSTTTDPAGNAVYTDGSVGSVNGNVVTTDTVSWAGGAADQELNITLDFSQYAGQSELVSKQQDGYSSGALTGVEVDNGGTVIASYSNGQSRSQFRLGLAKFANNTGLAQVGNSLFEATDSSGLPSIGTPGSGVGSIRSNALEQSTVDIAKEFTNMITTQRAYQANSRTITTTDEMLQEVVNLKR